ncbi:hypothetical protein GNE10_21585 [Nostoc sp. 2RC]|nr:hypothetical protein [Nostoc sp. 2RC]
MLHESNHSCWLLGKAFSQKKSEDKRNLLLAERATWGDARGYCSSEVKRNLSECFI